MRVKSVLDGKLEPHRPGVVHFGGQWLLEELVAGVVEYLCTRRVPVHEATDGDSGDVGNRFRNHEV